MRKITSFVIVIMSIFTACNSFELPNDETLVTTNETSTFYATQSIATTNATQSTTNTTNTEKSTSSTEPLAVVTDSPTITTEKTTEPLFPIIAEIDTTWVKSNPFWYDYFKEVHDYIYGIHLFGNTITSVKERDESYELLKNIPNNNDPNNNLSQVHEIYKKYDDDFFKNNVLVIYTFSDSATNARLTPKVLEQSENGVQLVIEIYEHLMGGDAMVGYIYFAEIPRKYYDGSNINIRTYTAYERY